MKDMFSSETKPQPTNAVILNKGERIDIVSDFDFQYLLSNWIQAKIFMHAMILPHMFYCITVLFYCMLLAG